MVQCRAKSKQSGLQCKNHAAIGKRVCRFHGANAGPKTLQGKARIKKANTKHGKYSKEAVERNAYFRNVVQDFERDLLGL